jgi:hypothetical protein
LTEAGWSGIFSLQPAIASWMKKETGGGSMMSAKRGVSFLRIFHLHSKSDEISKFVFLFLPPFAHFTQTQAVRLSFPRLHRSSRKAKSFSTQTQLNLFLASIH